jgi:NAD(P)-dependent dehydrogenase (short-subunit alcohol dehydrogenase family)
MQKGSYDDASTAIIELPSTSPGQQLARRSRPGACLSLVQGAQISGCRVVSGRLVDRVAVVVGGGQAAGETTGNGRAACLAYAQEGATVLVVDRDADAAEQTAELVRGQGGRAQSHCADVTSEDDCRSIPDRAMSQFGRLDVLHNNVGILLGAGTEALSVERWRFGFEVNLTGMWLTCKYVLPHMREQRSGAVINISSMAGLIAADEDIAYTTSKAAVNSLTRSLALAYAPYGVRVNALALGMIDTPMGVDQNARRSGVSRHQLAAQRAASIPMRRQGTSSDVASACVFLACDEAAYITGVVLPVDGGSTLRFTMKGPGDGRP